MKPLLPGYLKLEPYLKRIDDARWYTNFGGLVTEFEERLGNLFGAPCVTASSATSALTATIMALDLPKGSLIACPSWTFVATAAAIVAAGHVPKFVDVDDSGEMAISPAIVTKALVVAAPFGRPLDIALWEKRSQEWRVPIIIDAAAGFDSVKNVGKIPVVISTHATKPFSTGEGGFVLSQDIDLLKCIRHITNFGIESYGNVPYPGINGKMSEYHAAIGLAELDGWKEKREKWMEIKRWYGIDEEWASSSIPRRVEDTTGHVMSRYGVHTLKAYENYPRTEMNVTEKLMRETVMLPCWIGMPCE